MYTQSDSDTGGPRALAPYPDPWGNWLHATALDPNRVDGEVGGNQPGSFAKLHESRLETLKFFSGSLGPEESRKGRNILR